MATEAPVIVTSTVQRISDDLVDGTTYTIQNVGIYDVQYCNFVTDPSTASVGWRICEPRDFFTSGRIDDANNALWVRARDGNSVLSIGEA